MTGTVFAWLEEYCGNAAANIWLWELTPWPCGEPTQEQLEQGMLLATGELDWKATLDASYEEMERLSE